MPTTHAEGAAVMAPGRCPSCRGEWRSLGFVRDSVGYLRRWSCRRCGQVRDDEQTRLRLIDGGARAVALDDGDRDIVEVIAHLMGSGGLSLREMEVSDVSLAEIVERHGEPPSSLRGFAFPAYCWPVEHAAGHTTWLVVIDQGRMRISFHTRRRDTSPPD